MPRGRVPKDGIKKTFYIKKDIVEQFESFCEKTARSKTKVVEVALVEYMEKHKDEMD